MLALADDNEQRLGIKLGRELKLAPRSIGQGDVARATRAKKHVGMRSKWEERQDEDQ
jgi:hypothetical protein